MKHKNRPCKPFKITCPQELSLICEIAGRLHCSKATIYRTINACHLPVWNFVECLRGRKFISRFNLYKLIKTPAFKKYYSMLTDYADIPDAKNYESGTPLMEVATKLNLNDWELKAGVKSGLIPCLKFNNEIQACGWFLPAAESVYPWF